MSQSKFKVGQVVELNSGSPTMTIDKIIVNSVNGNVSYRCQWFAGKKLESGTFQYDSLKLVNNQETADESN